MLPTIDLPKPGKGKYVPWNGTGEEYLILILSHLEGEF